MSVDYDPKHMTITCTFENELDISPKSCRIEYGTCDRETYYVTKGNATDGPVILLLNSSATNLMNFCYVVAASNDTFTVMVKGMFMTPSSGDTPNTSRIIIITIVTIMVVGTMAAITTIIIAFLHARYIKLGRHGN